MKEKVESEKHNMIMSKNNSDDQDDLIEKTATMVDDSKDDTAEGIKTEKGEEAEEVAAGASDDEDDGDGEEEGASNRIFRIDSGLLPFPEKLMVLLDGNTVSDAMWWLPDGDSFCIIPSVFAEQVLDKHFSGTKFESFTRKLNRWGFKRVAGQRVPANTIAYYNKHFLRGNSKLLKNMNGGKTTFVSAREKRIRAQLKRERDQHQQQPTYQSAPGGVAGAPLSAAESLAGFVGGAAPGASTGLFRAIPAAAASLLGGASANNPAALQSLLASRQMLLQRQVQEMRLAEHVLAAEISAQKQREELQMRLLQQRGSAMADQATSNSLLQRAFHHPSPLQGTSAVSTTGAVGNLASVEQLLAARQQLAMASGTLPHASRSMIDRLLAQRMSINSSAPDAFMHQTRRMEQSHHRLPLQGDNKGGSPATPKPPATGGTGQIDPDLFKRYLLEQERKQKGL